MNGVHCGGKEQAQPYERKNAEALSDLLGKEHVSKNYEWKWFVKQGIIYFCASSLPWRDWSGTACGSTRPAVCTYPCVSRIRKG